MKTDDLLQTTHSKDEISDAIKFTLNKQPLSEFIYINDRFKNNPRILTALENMTQALASYTIMENLTQETIRNRIEEVISEAMHFSIEKGVSERFLRDCIKASKVARYLFTATRLDRTQCVSEHFTSDTSFLLFNNIDRQLLFGTYSNENWLNAITKALKDESIIDRLGLMKFRNDSKVILFEKDAEEFFSVMDNIKNMDKYNDTFEELEECMSNLPIDTSFKLECMATRLYHLTEGNLRSGLNDGVNMDDEAENKFISDVIENLTT